MKSILILFMITRLYSHFNKVKLHVLESRWSHMIVGSLSLPLQVHGKGRLLDTSSLLLTTCTFVCNSSLHNSKNIEQKEISMIIRLYLSQEMEHQVFVYKTRRSHY